MFPFSVRLLTKEPQHKRNLKRNNKNALDHWIKQKYETKHPAIRYSLVHIQTKCNSLVTRAISLPPSSNIRSIILSHSLQPTINQSIIQSHLYTQSLTNLLDVFHSSRGHTSTHTYVHIHTYTHIHTLKNH